MGKMQKRKSIHAYILAVAILAVVTVVGCSVPGSSTTPTTPTVISTSPIDTATVVAVNSTITATFSEKMKPSTINATTFTVENTTTSTNVTGVVTYDAVTMTASFAPTVVLIGSSTNYAVTITTGAQSSDGVALAANKVFGFSTTALGIGPAPLLIGTAGNFVILAKTLVSNTGTSAITGNIGLSPAATSFVTGFALTAIPGYGGATSAQVTGVVYAADMIVPTPANLTAAVSAMQAAYTAGLPPGTPAGTGAYLNVGGGTIGAATPPLGGGTYTWTSNLAITGNITLNGAANDVWVFQVPGTMTVSSAAQVLLTGGAHAQNVFWVVAGVTQLGTTSKFQGIILDATQITVQTGATLNGRALAQTAVTLSGNTLVHP
jgi:Ice-binding-like/Bacterial Ig-like domain